MFSNKLFSWISIVGASFTGFIVTFIVCVVVTVPSFTLNVITSFPLKFSFGVYVITFPFIVTTPFIAVAFEVNISPSISFSVNVIVVELSSSTVSVEFTSIVGALFKTCSSSIRLFNDERAGWVTVVSCELASSKTLSFG